MKTSRVKPSQTEQDKALHRLYCTSRWQQIRQMVLLDDPLCRECAKQGKLVPAAVVDHIVPHKGDLDLFYDLNNLQPLCKRCHDIKTVREDGGFGNMVTQRKQVYLVCGSPGSGKSHWVCQQKGPDDLVVDLDLICAALHGDMSATHREHGPVLKDAIALRDSVYRRIRDRSGDWARAWVITASPFVTDIRGTAKEIKADDIILVDSTLEWCLQQINADSKRAHHTESFRELARIWHARFDRYSAVDWTRSYELEQGGLNPAT